MLRAAHAGARSAPRRAAAHCCGRRWRSLLALAALGTVLSPAGADVRRWIGDRLDPEPSPTLVAAARRQGGCS